VTVTRAITTEPAGARRLRPSRRPLTARRFARKYLVGVIAILVSIVVFLVPFIFIVLQAVKDPKEAGLMGFTLPSVWQIAPNFVNVIETNNYQLLAAFINSFVLTIVSVLIMVVFSAMCGYLLHRRRSRLNPLVNFLVLAGLIVPPAVVPTIWVLQGLGMFDTLPGMILIEATLGLSFSILLFRAFVATIPRELDEAAIIDGAGPMRLFFRVILPLLRPVVVTVVVVQAVAVFNDFTGPLYFLPSSNNPTVQLTLYNFQSQSVSQYNLLFMNILLITIPPLIMYIFFNRQIVAGMTSGAVKG
jgi:raffinose/stachyose/melibiose transport system permease protein